MLRMIFTLISCLLFTSTSIAEGTARAETPAIGYVSGGYIYFPTYTSTHSAVPSRIFAYHKNSELVGVLRDTDSLIGPYERGGTEDYDPGYSGRYVYRIEGDIIPTGSSQVFIFRGKKYLKYENGVYFDTRSNLAWKVVELASSEGWHEYLQTLQEGKCISFIDYYNYVPYATESAGANAHKNARCGLEIKLNEVHP